MSSLSSSFKQVFFVVACNFMKAFSYQYFMHSNKIISHRQVFEMQMRILRCSRWIWVVSSWRSPSSRFSAFPAPSIAFNCISRLTTDLPTILSLIQSNSSLFLQPGVPMEIALNRYVLLFSNFIQASFSLLLHFTHLFKIEAMMNLLATLYCSEF